MAGLVTEHCKHTVKQAADESDSAPVDAERWVTDEDMDPIERAKACLHAQESFLDPVLLHHTTRTVHMALQVRAQDKDGDAVQVRACAGLKWAC